MKNEISRREAMRQMGCLDAAALLSFENTCTGNQDIMLQRNIPATSYKKNI